MRALQPVASGSAVNPTDQVRIAYEVFGPTDARRTITLLPAWSLVHSRQWKMQAPYFAQKGFRVVTHDGRGNGQCDRPLSGYTTAHFAADTLAVLDALQIEQTAIVAFSAGARWALQVAAEHPERVTHLVLIGSSVRLDGGARTDLDQFFAEPPDRNGWNKYNAVHWREDYPDFVDWFVGSIFSEPHSTKQIEDFTGWAHETTPDVLIGTVAESATPRMAEFVAAIRCPTLIMHGTGDRIAPLDRSKALHQAIGGSVLVEIEGSGHAPLARDPVKINQIIHDFLGHERPRTSSWRRAMTRQRRALFVSSPIGLGHVRRDLAIADELRNLVPDLTIDWLAQHPVTEVLAARGECIHPASHRLAGESAHIESEMTGEHELNVFRAWRDMDEILLANFHVFHDAAANGHYDLWLGDEAWDVDYYLHENPELKTAPFVWLTDFVGWLPMQPDRDGREAFLTRDYNAEMIEQVERFPSVRDLALFIGNPEDIVPEHFGEGLPPIRRWTEAHYDFVGYTSYLDTDALAGRERLRTAFGFRKGEPVAVATVGGTSVGSGLLRRIIDAYGVARDLVPGLRLIVVGGPRIDLASLPSAPGIEYRGFVTDLPRMLAAADVSLVQGGLATTMELVAARRPFLYFPLTGHCEQNRHVVYRLERYGVPTWARIPFAQAEPSAIASRLAQAIAHPVSYRPLEADGARRAAERIAALL